jgi:hypothetical protein
MVKGMKESNSEGVATHAGPEPCTFVRQDGGEASVGERTGRVLSGERDILRGADAERLIGSRHGHGAQ